MASSRGRDPKWNDFKTILYRLWIECDLPTLQVMDHMRQHHNFIDNKNAYDRQFRRWGWRKNGRKSDWALVRQHVRRRDLQQKESEVRMYGALVPWEQRASRYHDASHQQMSSPGQELRSLPNYLKITTPPPRSGASVLSSLPLSLFMSTLQRQFAQLDTSTPGDSSSLTLVSSFDLASPNNVLPMGDTLAGMAIALPSRLSSLSSIVYSLTNEYPVLGQPSQRIDEGQKKWSNPFSAIGQTSLLLITQALLHMTGPTAETILSLVMFEALQRDDTNLAQLLLTRVDVDRHVRVGPQNSDKPVDLIRSYAMMKLCLEKGMHIQEATAPFKRLYWLQEGSEISMVELIRLYRIFTDAKHTDLSRAIFYVVYTGDESLIHSALNVCTPHSSDLVFAALWSFHAHMDHDIQDLLFDLLGPDWDHEYGSDVLVWAMSKKLPRIIERVLATGASLGENVVLHDLPGVVRIHEESRVILTPLEFAVKKGYLDLATTILEVGADTFGGHLPDFRRPKHHLTIAELLGHSIMSEDTSIVRKLLALGAPANDIISTDNLKIRDNSKILSIGLREDCRNILTLSVAAAVGNLDIVKFLIANGATVNPRATQSLQTPLEAACYNGHSTLAIYLLSEGAAISAETEHWGHSAVVASRRSYPMFALLKPYLDPSRDINRVSRDGVSPLVAALGIDEFQRADPRKHNHQMAQDLMRHWGAQVRESSSTPSPLAVAVASRCEECLDLVFERTPTVDAKALWEARNGGINTFAKLVHFAVCNCKSGNASDMLFYKCLHGLKLPHDFARNMARVLLRPPSQPSINTVGLYYSHGGMRCSEALNFLNLFDIDWGTECMRVTVLDCYRLKYNDLTCEYPPAIIWDTESRVRIKWLLDKGVSPAHYEAAVVSSCCRRRIEPSLSLIDVAVRQRDVQLLVRLLDAGADPNAISSSGRFIYLKTVRTEKTTPILSAVRGGSLSFDILKILIQRGGNPHRPALGLRRWTALQVAAGRGDLVICQYLLHQHRVDPNERPSRIGGSTALQAAARGGHISVVHELIEAGANVNCPRPERCGYTALEAAVEQGRLDTVSLLLLSGADVSNSDFGREQFRRSARHARKRHHQAILEMLETEARKQREVSSELRLQDA